MLLLLLLLKLKEKPLQRTAALDDSNVVVCVPAASSIFGIALSNSNWRMDAVDVM